MYIYIYIYTYTYTTTITSETIILERSLLAKSALSAREVLSPAPRVERRKRS